MSRSCRRPLAFLPAAGLVALAVLLALATPAFAKDYHFGRIDIEAAVADDGSMIVAEQREFVFDGEFHWAQWALNTKGDATIEVLGASLPGRELRPGQGDISAAPEEGTYLVANEPGRVVLKVGFSAADERLPVTIRYKVTGAAKRWKDTAELYWQFIGDESDVRAEEAVVRITLPGALAKPDVKAWAHGPLQGTVAIGADGNVRLDVKDLPANTFVEARVLFPESALPKAPALDQERAAAVQSEEARLAEEANARRRSARALVAVAFVVGLGFPLVMFAIVFRLFWSYGREYKPKDFPGGYFRDIPSEHAPPLVAALWHMGQPADADIGATLMDLSLKGALYMHPVTQQVPGGFMGLGQKDEQTYELQLQRDKLGGIDPLERSLVAFLFEREMGRDTFTIQDLREHAKEHPKSFTSGLSAWKSEVGAEAARLGWVESRSKGMQALAFVLAVLAVIVAGVALAYTEQPLMILGLLPGLGAFAMAFFMQRRSREAVELHAKYEGLRDYLRDFSRLDEKPPSAVILWEKYLVLAVIFGIAEEVIGQMRVAVPDVVNDPTFATAYWWAAPSMHGGSSPVGSVSTGFAAAVTAANSAMSSSSGGGGGFSGGGGGGGGGGGVSAG